jgi:hypothetical protein
MLFNKTLQPGYLGFFHDRTSQVLDLLNWDIFSSVSHPDIPSAISRWTGHKTGASEWILMDCIFPSKPVMKPFTDYAALFCGELDMAGHLEDTDFRG